MLSFGKDYIAENISATDFEDLGVVTSFDIGNRPFYRFKYKGESLNKTEE